MNKILIAEDEKFIRQGLKTMVRRASVPVEEILEARDGEEALAILREQPVDLLITDIRMPKMDGIQLVSQLDTIGQRPMVLVVSGYDDFSYAVEMLRNGASDYLLKPVERERLYEALTKLEDQFQRRQAAEEEQNQQARQALRQLMLEQDTGSGEWEELEAQCAAGFFPAPMWAFVRGSAPGPCRMRRCACAVRAGSCFTQSKRRTRAGWVKRFSPRRDAARCAMDWSSSTCATGRPAAHGSALFSAGRCALLRWRPPASPLPSTRSSWRGWWGFPEAWRRSAYCGERFKAWPVGKSPPTPLPGCAPSSPSS